MTDTSPEAVERLRGEVMTLEHLGGTWVTAEDYLALAAKLAEVERENEKLHFAKAIGLEWKTRAEAAEAAEAALATAREDNLREAAALCQGLAEQHADAVLTGLPHNARIREGMEAAFTNARYAIIALIERKP